MIKGTILFICLELVLGFTAQDSRAADPPELSTLRSRWLKSRASAVAPIDKIYEAELEAMKTRFTKAGNLEAALAVDAEIKQGLEAAALSKNTVGIPPGIWKIEYSNRKQAEIRKDPNGEVTYSFMGEKHERVSLRMKNSEWIVEDKRHNTVERWTVAGDKLMIEQWWPAETYEKQKAPTTFGYAIRIK